MATANIKAVITAEDRASATLSQFGKNIDTVGHNISNAMKVAAAATAVAISVGIIKNVDNAIRRLDTLNNSARTFENLGFAAGDVSSAMEALDKSIRGLPTPLDDAVRGLTMITSATNDIGKSRKIYTALNNAVLGFGGTTEQVSNAVVQLSQDLAGGRITGQTWLSMLNSGIGPALTAISRQMGITTRDLKEGLSDGSISVEQFTNSLIELDEKGGGGMKSLQQIAKDSTKGISSSIQNMNTAITRGLANILNSIGRDKIALAIQNIGVAVEKLSVSFINISREIANYLEPKFGALKRTLEESMPTFERLRKEILEPLAVAFGTTLVIALGLLVDAINIMMSVLMPAIQWMLDNKVTVISLATAFVILGVAMNFTAIVAAFNGAMNSAIITMNVVRLITIPSMIASLGALAATFAIPAAAAVVAAGVIIDAGNKAKAAWDNTNAAIRNAGNSNDEVIRKLHAQVKAGTLSGDKAAEIIRSMTAAPRRAAGGPVNAEKPYMVGEQGRELFIPKTSGTIVNADKTSRMMGGGSSVNININAGAFMGSEVEARKYANQILSHLKDIAGSKGMTVSQMLG